MNAEKALQILLQGNERFVKNEMTHPNQSEDRRVEVTSGQHPFAVVLTCSDSRTPPEIIFDRGIGDLFVVRTAGNITGEVTMGSIELAVEECNVPLIVVPGHQYCGAIKLALSQTEYSGHMGTIMNRIKPAVLKAQGLPGNLQDNTAKENVKIVVDLLKISRPILSKRFDEGKLKIVGGYYWLDDGRVEMIA